jgi:ABC-type uncharacterized transport system substrate-binding protein
MRQWFAFAAPRGASHVFPPRSVRPVRTIVCTRDVPNAAGQWIAAVGAVLLILASLAPCRPAQAHPHVFVEAATEILFDADGRMTHVRHAWKFDRAFSAFAAQGLDKNGDGKLSDSELAPLAKINVNSLAEYGFFTWLSIDRASVKLGLPDTYFLRSTNGQLTLYFDLPLSTPARPGAMATLEVFDPEYFVAFTFSAKEPVTLFHAPPGCAAKYRPPRPLDAKIMARLSAVPADQHDLPPALRDAAAGLAHLMEITCPQ